MADPDQIFSFEHTEVRLRDLLHFIELPEFSEDCITYDLSESDLVRLQYRIMKSGKQAPVISGTGGVRKVRFVPSKWNQGKSGALRICFALFPRFHTALLIYIYAKNVREDLSLKRECH